MNKRTVILATLMLGYAPLIAQKNIAALVDSIRIAYQIPELNYAVLSSEKILDIRALGVKKRGSSSLAQLDDRFRIGSNTKTVTAYMAAVLIKKGEITWETCFFDLFPALKPQSDSAYYSITLRDCITLRANLAGWTYTNKQPNVKKIKGNKQQQRYQFISWILRQKPPPKINETYWANPSYVAAGMMLEQATGKSYETLLKEFGDSLGIHFGFGQPNYTDPNQPWGHNAALIPEQPSDQARLNWLSSAGNLNVSLPDYAIFIQIQLQGLQGKNALFSAAEFETMLYGLPEFSYGWKSFTDKKNTLRYAYHVGNPGTFLTKVLICKATDRGYIFFTNIQSDAAEEGINAIFELLSN
jgi:CubicO group peptidase (beta-lactamase class C family)